MRADPRVTGPVVVGRAIGVLRGRADRLHGACARPEDADVERAALAEGLRAGWTERPMALTAPPTAGFVPAGIDVRLGADQRAVVRFGRVVASANEDPGERERAPLLFHDQTIVISHVAAFVAHADAEPVSCAMTLLSHRVEACSMSRRSSTRAGVGLVKRSSASLLAVGSKWVPTSAIHREFVAWQDEVAPIANVFAPEMTWPIEGRPVVAGDYANRQGFIDRVLAPFGARGRGERFRPVRIHALCADDDAVIVRWDGHGVAIDGITYDNSYAWFMTMRDGLVIDGTAYFDSIASRGSGDAATRR